MIIDMHNHVFPDHVAERVIGALEGFYGFKWGGTGTEKDLLASLEEGKIDKCVIFSSATKPEQVETINNYIASMVQKAPSLYIGFGTMHPLYKDPVKEFGRFPELHLKGLKFHHDFLGYDLDDPLWMPIYAAAEEAGLPILFHIGDARTSHTNPDKLAFLRGKFPKLTLIAAHMGGYTQWEDGEKHLAGLDIYMDISSTIPFWGVEKTRNLVLKHGVDKILFASDYPAFRHKDAVAFVKQLELGEEAEEKIFHLNAEKLFGLDKE